MVLGIDSDSIFSRKTRNNNCWTMAPSSSSRPPTKKMICVKKKTEATKFAINTNETSLNICWDPSKMLETDSPAEPVALNAILNAMGVNHLTAVEQTELVRKYNSCHAKMTGKKSKMIAPKLHEVLRLMKDWSPKTDLICLHVRWAKKSPRNFHLDSISTLLTVAHQCGFDPVDFLIKAKTLVVHPRTSRNGQGKFGVKFSFKTANSQTVDEEHISRRFAGLALTLHMLQSAAVGSRGTLGKVGMRQSGARTPSLIPLPNDDNSGETPRSGFFGIPMMEFHQEASLHHRLWMNIDHRWMA
jgi:hypothetical protein